MKTFYSSHHLKHNPPAEFLHGKSIPFYEQPRRISAILEKLTIAEIHQPQTPIDPAMLSTIHEPAMIAYLHDLSVHVIDHLKADFAVYDMQNQVTEDMYYYESMFPPNGDYFIYDNTSPIGRGSWEAILYSATLAVAGANAILQGEPFAYALCRPPGHHAGRRFAGGYCYVCNAALAAYVLKQSRVAILDIDYHHGNGTQDIVQDDPDIMFVSIHADPAVDYPHYAGYAHENNDHIINLPLPHGTDETAYLRALDTALDHIRRFEPAHLVVSLGFDTYKGDPMGKFLLDIPFYRIIGQRIAALNLPTLYVQEGGYAVDQLGNIAVSFFNGVKEV
ncbi:MAG: histone deacetylase family protein [Phototrophicales bacterium]|nr:MAG: histone deacetylase family protein [Phototrophicales bacterium]